MEKGALVSLPGTLSLAVPTIGERLGRGPGNRVELALVMEELKLDRIRFVREHRWKGGRVTSFRARSRYCCDLRILQIR